MSANVLEVNPYAAPATVDPAPYLPVTDEQIRLDHFKLERAVKSVGAFYGLCSLIAALAACATLTVALTPPVLEGMWIVGAVQAAVACLFGIVCVGLRRLKSSARGAAVIFSLPLLAAFPFGTLISIYILCSLLCKKGRFVLSDEYREIVRRTPQVRHRTEVTTWIALGVIVLLIGWAILAVVTAS